jgi:NADH dehydrogenase
MLGAKEAGVKPRVVILGGGFAGLWAARGLSRRAAAGDIDVTLVSPRPSSDFNPLLPDVVGGRTQLASATYSLHTAADRWSLTFRRAAARHVDVDARAVETDDGTIPFDYLILATGARTNFRGRDDLKMTALTLDSAQDACRIRQAAIDRPAQSFVIAGGGPTGVEVATNLRLRCHPGRPRIVLAEYLPRLCSLLPPSHGRYILRNLGRMGIDVRLETTVENVDGGDVLLSDGERLTNAQLFWAAGVAPAEIAQSLPGGHIAGRAATDKTLRAGEGIYAAGDAAGFTRAGEQQPIRMSVQHAIGGGMQAAKNVLREIDGKTPEPFKPLDLGYIVPMANGRSCGKALGVPVFGAVATGLHYLMSGFRSQSATNVRGVLHDALACYLDARRFE